MYAFRCVQLISSEGARVDLSKQESCETTMCSSSMKPIGPFFPDYPQVHLPASLWRQYLSLWRCWRLDFGIKMTAVAIFIFKLWSNLGSIMYIFWVMVRNSDLSPYLCIREGEIWTLSKPEYPSTAKFRNGYFSDALLLFLFFFLAAFLATPAPFSCPCTCY